MFPMLLLVVVLTFMYVTFGKSSVRKGRGYLGYAIVVSFSVLGNLRNSNFFSSFSESSLRSSFMTVFCETDDDDWNALKNAADNLLVIDFLCLLCFVFVFYLVLFIKETGHTLLFPPLSSSFNWPCFTRLPFKGFVFIWDSQDIFSETKKGFEIRARSWNRQQKTKNSYSQKMSEPIEYVHC